MGRLVVLAILGGLLAVILAAGGAGAYLSDDEMVVFLSVEPELADTSLEPGEPILVDVEVTNHGGFEAVPLSLTVDGTPVRNETVHDEEAAAITFEWDTPAEPTLVDVAVEVHVEDRTFVEPVGLVVVGDPAVDTLAVDVPGWLPAGDVADYFEWETGLEATIDDTTYGVEHLAAITANGEEIDRVSDWEAADTDGSVTFEATYGGETTTATVPVVADPADLTLQLDPEPLYAGETAAYRFGPADHDEPAPVPRDPVVQNESVATVTATTIEAHAPGETTVSIRQQHVFGAPLEVPLTVEPSPPDLTIELDSTELAVGETTRVGVYATDIDGETTEVTLPVELEIANESVLGFEDGQLVGLAPGETELVASYEWRTVTATVTVRASADDGLGGPAVVVTLLGVGVAVLAWREWRFLG